MKKKKKITIPKVVAKTVESMKNIQCNIRENRPKKTNTGLQNITQKTKD